MVAEVISLKDHRKSDPQKAASDLLEVITGLLDSAARGEVKSLLMIVSTPEGDIATKAHIGPDDALRVLGASTALNVAIAQLTME